MDIKERIYQSTEQLFSKHGIKKTKLDDIATDCKISKKTIYTLFKGKDDLVLKIFEHKISEIEEYRIAFYDEPAIPFVNKLFLVFKSIRDYVDLFSLPLLVEVRDNYPKVRAMIDAYVDRGIFERFKQLFEEGIENSFIKTTANFETVSLGYKDAILGILDLRLLKMKTEFKENTDYVEAYIYTILSLFRGILSEESLKEFDMLTNGISSKK